MLKIGLLGLGAIGSDVIEMAKNEFADRIEIPAVLVRRPRDPAIINRTAITNDFDTFFSKETDLILEVAGHSTVQDYGERILKAGKDFMVTSVGAFTDDTPVSYTHLTLPTTPYV